jgi:hypothetical protein
MYAAAAQTITIMIAIVVIIIMELKGWLLVATAIFLLGSVVILVYKI